jgi:hypothetical protein
MTRHAEISWSASSPAEGGVSGLHPTEKQLTYQTRGVGYFEKKETETRFF